MEAVAKGLDNVFREHRKKASHEKTGYDFGRMICFETLRQACQTVGYFASDLGGTTARIE